MLWEIGTEGCEVRSLRSRLGLDSGHASRLMRALEADGLVCVEPSPADRRIRIARLTKDGLAERAVLDRRSDDLAASILEPLDQPERDQMIDAMRTVRRLMTRSLVEIVVADPAGRDAQRCIRAYFAELDRRSESKFDPTAGISAEPHELVAPAGVFLIAYMYGEPVGCGAAKHHPGAPSHIKRMWVAESARGLGIGRRLLAELEGHVARSGATVAQLETQRTLIEAYRHVPLGRLSRGAGVQRRAVRASLVREARRLTPVAGSPRRAQKSTGVARGTTSTDPVDRSSIAREVPPSPMRPGATVEVEPTIDQVGLARLGADRRSQLGGERVQRSAAQRRRRRRPGTRGSSRSSPAGRSAPRRPRSRSRSSRARAGRSPTPRARCVPAACGTRTRRRSSTRPRTRRTGAGRHRSTPPAGRAWGYPARRAAPHRRRGASRRRTAPAPRDARRTRASGARRRA